MREREGGYAHVKSVEVGLTFSMGLWKQRWGIDGWEVGVGGKGEGEFALFDFLLHPA